MTRLLVPEAYGVMAIAIVTMAGLAMFSDIGLRQNIIQSRRGDDVLFLNTAWVIQIARGLLLCICAIGICCALFLANHGGMIPEGSAYAATELPLVIATLSVSAIIQGFESTKLLEAGRNLALRKVTFLEMGSQLTGLVCMFTWVIFDHSVWALVFGSICTSFTKALLSHVILPGTDNRWQWDSNAINEIVGFGKWIFLSSILGFLINSGDRLILGGLISAQELGVYTIAFLIINTVDQLLTKIISNVSLPVLSEIARSNPSILKTTYYKIHLPIALFSYFCAGSLVVGGQTIIHILFDTRYAAAGWMLQLLSITLLSVPFRLATECFVALGNSKIMTQIAIWRVMALYALVPIGFYIFGLEGALIGVVISNFARLPTLVSHQIRHQLFDIKRELIALPVLPIAMILTKGFCILIER